ncbi:hypothetical protein GOV03_05065 [Candidatus Woesearchaeota archaeon]|nr:hypothetical protein [Candidatus Woesearchaeota archaeon]
MQKRGQVTVFIVVGILILAITGATLYLSSMFKTVEQDNLLKLEELKAPVKSQVNYCIEKSMMDGIFYVGMQGGYYFPAAVSEQYWGGFIPYYFYDEEEHVPSMGELEEQLSTAVKFFLPACLDKALAFFEKERVEVKYEIKEIKTRVTATKVMVEADLPITITIGGVKEEEGILDLDKLNDQTSFTELTDFVVSVDIAYKKMLDWSKEIILLQAKDPQWFQLGDISDLAFEEGFTYEIISVDTVYGERAEVEGFEDVEISEGDDRNKVLISIVDNELFDKPYYFTFGIWYDVNYEELFAEDMALEEEMDALLE